MHDCMRARVQTHTPRHMNMYTHKCTYIHAHVPAHIHKHTHINMYILVPTHTMSIYIHVYMHTQEPASLYTCSHIPAHTRTYMPRWETFHLICLPPPMPWEGKHHASHFATEGPAEAQHSLPVLPGWQGRLTALWPHLAWQLQPEKGRQQVLGSPLAPALPTFR